jgi:salicylate hydroxylase
MAPTDNQTRHNVLSGGEFVQYIATVRDDAPDGSWKKTVSATEMKQFFHDYPPHLQSALAAVIGEEKQSDYMCTFEHLPARTYADGPICVVGDAAHATTPWQGSGGGISIEDALILSSLLAHVKSPHEVATALQVYDEVRRPRTQRVVESSKGTGLIFTGRNPEYPMSCAGLQGKLSPRWDFILDYDNEKARDEAVQLLSRRIGV